MPEWLSILITALATFLASSGFWSYLSTKDSKQTSRMNLLKGLGYFAIHQTANDKLRMGYITNEEYNEVYRYLYEPYVELGGNGSAERIMDVISKLPQKSERDYYGHGGPPSPEERN